MSPAKVIMDRWVFATRNGRFQQKARLGKVFITGSESCAIQVTGADDLPLTDHARHIGLRIGDRARRRRPISLNSPTSAKPYRYPCPVFWNS